jgi:hypothetical protein
MTYDAAAFSVFTKFSWRVFVLLMGLFSGTAVAFVSTWGMDTLCIIKKEQVCKLGNTVQLA